MQPSLIGYNIEGGDLGSRRAQVINELKSYRANWQFCLGDEALALDLLNHTHEGVILRIFDPFGEYGKRSDFDNDFWLHHTPQAVVDWILTHKPYLVGVANLWLTVGNNEPQSQPHQVPALLQWHIDLMQLGHKHGIRFAVGEFASAKTVYHDQIKSGVWDEFLRVADQYRDFHIVTCHEYTTGLLPATAIAGYPLNLDEPQVVHFNQWQGATLNLDSISGNYHIGRMALVTHVRAKQLGLQPLPFVVTECAFDWMADVVSTMERELEIYGIRANFDMPHHDELRGSTGHKLYHEWLMREQGFSGDWNDYLFEQYKWLVNAYPSECQGVCIFALNNDWDLPEGHDMAQPRNDGFRQRVINEAVTKGDTVTPIVFNPTLYPATVRMVAGTLNIRADMSTNSTDLGDIAQEPIEMRVSKVTNEANGYQWYKFERDLTTNTQVGYFADVDNLRIEYADTTPDDDTDTDSDGGTNDTPDSDSGTDSDTPISDELRDLVKETVTEVLNGMTEDVLIDIPFPDATFTANALTLPIAAEFAKLQRDMWTVIHNRLSNPTPTLSQVANAIYDTSSATSTEGMPTLDEFGNILIGLGDEENDAA